MRNRYRHFLTALAILTISLSVSATIPTPSAQFGFEPGTDGQLIDYTQLIQYLDILDQHSDRIRMVDAGKSPMGRSMKICFLSSPENLQNLDRLQEINRKLALEPLSDVDQRELTAEGRVFVMMTLSMHSTEVGPSQSLPHFAWTVATSEDPDLNDWLNDVVLMMIPCHNPDGMDMVVNHFRKHAGTKYEGSMLPGVYHKYVGHDNNRDFVTLTQSDTRVIADIYSIQWYPQVLVEKHQMGSTGPRYFVPEYHDPIAENVDEEMWTWIDVFGANLSRDMTADGCSGVASHWAFDDYWPGSTETSLWKNVISLLTEAASCKVAKPVYVEPQELRVRGKGLAEYKKGVNLPDPWPGGWWRLSDIIRYELSSIRSITRTASVYRKDILTFRNNLCRKEIEKGQTRAPACFVIPDKQHDPGERNEMVKLLQRHGVHVYRMNSDLDTDNYRFKAGDLVIPLAQPYRAFIKEVLEAQQFPVRHYTPGGDVIRPYDIASWSLPLHRGVTSIMIEKPVNGLADQMELLSSPYQPEKTVRYKSGTLVLPTAWNASYSLVFQALSLGIPVYRVQESGHIADVPVQKGDFLVSTTGKKVSLLDKLAAELPAPVSIVKGNGNLSTRALKLPRIGLVETWFHDMDAGWTRYVLDTAKIPFNVLRPGEMEELDYSKFDVIIFPDADPDVLKTGAYKNGSDYYVPDMPPAYRKGMGEKGLLNLVRFINDGGVVLAWGKSTGLFTGSLKEPAGEDKTESFRLPVRDISSQVKQAGLYVPGSLLRLNLKPDHPVSLGMTETVNVFSRGTPVFSTSIPRLDMDRRILGTFPETDILLSGYAEHEEKLANRAAAVWLKKGNGQLVLLGFNPQFRASTSGVYKLLFNSLLLKP